MEGIGCMTYADRRDAYLQHIYGCRVCVSTFTGKQKYGLRNTGGTFILRQSGTGEPLAAVSQFCTTGRQLIESVLT